MKKLMHSGISLSIKHLGLFLVAHFVLQPMVIGSSDLKEVSKKPISKKPNKVPFSLMFPTHQLPSPIRSLQKPRRGLFLGGILYTNPQTWVVWLNGQRFYPKSTHKEVTILTVTATSINLLWRTEGQTHKIKLLTNQTYFPKSRKTQWGNPGVIVLTTSLEAK